MAITKVTTDVITDLAVTAPKLAADSVITDKIADNAVTAAKIAAGALGDQVAGISSSASATTIAGTLGVAGDLTVDTNTLFVDVSANKVGVGTTSPEYEFEVKASTDASINIRAGTSSGDFAGLYFGDTDYPAEGRITYQNSDNKMRFWSDRQHVMTLDDNARVGIGTASPSSIFHVVAEGNNGQRIHVGTSSAHQIYLGNTGGVSSVGTLTGHEFQLITNGASRLFVDNLGNVGINSSATNAKLEIVATSGEVLRADSNGGAYRLVVNQTGTNMQGVVDILGTTLVHGVSNYTGLEVKGSGGSRPMIQWSNANNGDLAAIYGTEANAMVICSGSSNTAAMTVDSSQRINMPGQPCFSAALPAVTNGGNVIVWGGEHLDVGGHFNTSNGKFTAPVAGNYYFAFWILLDPANPANYSRILFRKNGGASTQWTDNLESTDVQSTQAYHSVGGSCVMPLAANDYVETYNDGQNPTYGTSYGNWSGFLVS